MLTAANHSDCFQEPDTGVYEHVTDGHNEEINAF